MIAFLVFSSQYFYCHGAVICFSVVDWASSHKKPSVNSEIGDLRNKVAASALHFLQYFGTVGWTWKSTCPIKIE